jgi:hypothetical protein
LVVVGDVGFMVLFSDRSQETKREWILTGVADGGKKTGAATSVTSPGSLGTTC